MRTYLSVLMAATSLFAMAPASSVHAECDPNVVTSPTRFPLQSRLRGQQGVVLLEVKVDESGRVARAEVLQSSGYDRLDRAASLSIRDSWRFNVTGCERKDLPATDLVSVEYRYDNETR